MKIYSISLLLLCSICSTSFSQHIGMSFQDTEKNKIKIEELEKKYKSAVVTPPTESVLKDEELQSAYTKLLQDLGKFLAKNNFERTEKNH